MRKMLVVSGLAFFVGLVLGWLHLSRFINRVNAQQMTTRMSGRMHDETLHLTENNRPIVGTVNADEVIHVKIGARRFAYQFSSLLPQVHLTLISILQGVALAVLIEQLDYKSVNFNELPFFAASLIIIALIWHLYVSAFVTFVWPFWGLHTLLQFLLGAVEIFTFASISESTIWVLGISAMAFVGASIRWLNTRIVSPINYEKSEDYLLDMGLERGASRQLFWTGTSLLIVGTIRNILGLQQNQYVELLDLIIGLLISAIAVLLLIVNDKTNTRLIENIFKDSLWVLRNYQVVERRNHQD